MKTKQPSPLIQKYAITLTLNFHLHIGAPIYSLQVLKSDIHPGEHLWFFSKAKKTPPILCIFIWKPAIIATQKIKNYKHSKINFWWRKMNLHQLKNNFQQIKSRTNIPSKIFYVQNCSTVMYLLRLTPLLQSIYFRKEVPMKCLMVTHMHTQVLNQKSHLTRILCFLQVLLQALSKLWHHNFKPNILKILQAKLKILSS